MVKVHFLSSSIKTNSGFATVAKNIAQELKKLGYDVTMSGFQTVTVPEYTYGLKTLPIATDSNDEILQFKNNLMQIDPDVVIYIGDMYGSYRNTVKVFPRTIVHIPIEGVGVPTYMIEDLNYIATNGGRVVAECSYGFNEMIKADVQSIGFIYCGFDEKIYKQLSQQEIVSRYCFLTTEVGKESIDPKKLCGCHNCNILQSEQIFCPKFEDELISFCKCINNTWTEKSDFPIYRLKEEFNNKFIFLFVGQNHSTRKKIDRLLMAFQLLLTSQQLKDRIHLHLHTNPRSTSGIVDLLELVNTLGLQENVSFSYGTWRSSGWSEEAISRLYNLSDVNVTATSSEGFGLPILESMACGIPQVGTNCTSLPELITNPPLNNKDQIGQRGLLARINDVDTFGDMTKRELVDIADLSMKMKEMYTNKDLRESCSKNCIKFVKPYTWNQLTLKWDKLIIDILK